MCSPVFGASIPHNEHANRKLTPKDLCKVPERWTQNEQKKNYFLSGAKATTQADCQSHCIHWIYWQKMDTEGEPFWNLIMECIFAAFFIAYSHSRILRIHSYYSPAWCRITSTVFVFTRLQSTVVCLDSAFRIVVCLLRQIPVILIILVLDEPKK